MSEKKYPVITISREYGAGGRSVAKGLSEKLGIPWYDNDFVKLTAEQSGFSEETIKNEGEEISSLSRALDSVLNNGFLPGLFFKFKSKSIFPLR